MNSTLERTLHQLVTLFLKENSVTNLSAHRTEKDCWEANILDSLPVLGLLPPEVRGPRSEVRIIDVGTGGGFPLLPIAIARPDIRCTGLDSTKKKVDAIGRMATALGLSNVELAVGRAETLGHDPQYREQFDVVTARAVASLSVLLEYCSPFAKPGGMIVLWKSMDIADERKDSATAQKKLHCLFEASHPYDLGERGKRQLLVFRKARRLDDHFPRAVGVPTLKPL